MFEDLLSDLQPFAAALVDAAGRAGLQPRVTSTRRSSALQKKLYEKFLRGESRYPAAPPGQSAHEFGYAFDMLVEPYDSLADVGYTWQQWGGVWHPSDPIHFEYPGFVPGPPVEPTLAERAGESYLDLPWYASIFLPGGAASTAAPARTVVTGKVAQQVGVICANLPSLPFC